MDIYAEISRFYESCVTQKTVIGKSLFGRNIYAVKIGDGYPVGIVQYAIHGREWITSKLALYHYRNGVKGTLWLVPLVNPDGALLSQCGLKSVTNRKHRKRLQKLCPDGDFSRWKANGRGVDLNVNFDAEYGKGVKNVRCAGAENAVGKHAFSEPETRALRAFTLRVKPDYTVSYHTKGEEIYWCFHQSESQALRDCRLAEMLAEVTGYPAVCIEGSTGGYKDWCICRLHIPAFTIEAGKDETPHPLREDSLQDIIEKNGDVLRRLSMDWKT